MGTEASQAHLAYHRRAQKRRGRKHHRKGPRPLPVASAPVQPLPIPEPEKPHEVQPTVLSGGEGVFDHKPRSTAIMVKRLLGFDGVFKPDEIDSLLRAGGTLAAKAAAAGREREYRAAMSVLLTAAKMQLDAEKSDKPAAGTAVQVNVGTGAGVESSIQVYVPDNGRDRPYEDDDDLDE